jgi:hypothetical protein
MAARADEKRSRQVNSGRGTRIPRAITRSLAAVFLKNSGSFVLVQRGRTKGERI